MLNSVRSRVRLCVSCLLLFEYDIVILLYYIFKMSTKKSILFNTVPVSDTQMVYSLKKARKIPFPLQAFPETFVQWISALAFSINTKPEFILLSVMSVISTLVGPKTKIKIRDRYHESCNLFLVCLSEPGAGKSQAFEVTVEEPLKQLKSPASSIVVHDFTRKGLFQHLVAHEGRALLAHSEMSSFYELILKKQQEGSGERQFFCRLYDGSAEWALTTASLTAKEKEKREVLEGSALALGGFTQPGPFLQLFKPLAKIKDGFLDRILICFVKPFLLHEEEIEEWGNKLDGFKLQGFKGNYCLSLINSILTGLSSRKATVITDLNFYLLHYYNHFQNYWDGQP